MIDIFSFYHFIFPKIQAIIALMLRKNIAYILFFVTLSAFNLISSEKSDHDFNIVPFIRVDGLASVMQITSYPESVQPGVHLTWGVRALFLDTLHVDLLLPGLIHYGNSVFVNGFSYTGSTGFDFGLAIGGAFDIPLNKAALKIGGEIGTSGGFYQLSNLPFYFYAHHIDARVFARFPLFPDAGLYAETGIPFRYTFRKDLDLALQTGLSIQIQWQWPF